VSISIYGIEKQKILSIRFTNDKKEKHVNLLYVQDPRDENGYLDIWIFHQKLSWLVSLQLSKHKNKKYFCD